jgi:hypothetical protein
MEHVNSLESNPLDQHYRACLTMGQPITGLTLSDNRADRSDRLARLVILV